MTANATVRVTTQTRDRLNRLGKQRGMTTPQLIEQLASRAEEDQMLADMNAGFERLNADPAARAEYDAQLAAWDSTLRDGLEGL